MVIEHRSRRGFLSSIEIIGAIECFELADALDCDWDFSKASDPIEDGRDGLSRSEAEEIAREDPSLIFLEFDAMSAGDAWRDILGYFDIQE